MTIVFLLSQEEYPGVSPRELEDFKRQFRTSAYTCRFGSCARATLGFESKEVCLEHELAHLRRWACTVVGCQYPPFTSARALQTHKKAHHDNDLGQRPIRKSRKSPDVNSNLSPTVREFAASSQAHSPVLNGPVSGSLSLALGMFGRLEAPYRILGQPLPDLVRLHFFFTPNPIFMWLLCLRLYCYFLVVLNIS